VRGFSSLITPAIEQGGIPFLIKAQVRFQLGGG
jgi:hypothetical protein